MLIWLVLIPLIAAALIGLCKAPARPTALLSSSLTLALGIWALVSFDGCSSCWSRFEGMDLQLTLAPALSKVMLLLTILVTFATVLGTNPPQGGEASWYNSALLISAGATGAFLSDNIISFFAFHELALIPTFVMIGLYGRGDRRTTAWRATLYLGLASMVLLAAWLHLLRPERLHGQRARTCPRGTHRGPAHRRVRHADFPLPLPFLGSPRIRIRSRSSSDDACRST